MTEIKLPPLPDWFDGYSEADKHVVQQYTAAAIEAVRQTTDKQFAAYKRLTESLESRIALLQTQYDRLKKATDPSLLESERAVNALLTEEVELLKADRQGRGEPAKPRPELLELAESVGAVITGKPDGSEPITIAFSVQAWRSFDKALLQQASEPVAWQTIETAPKDGTEIIVYHPEAGVCAAFCPADGFAWHCMDGQNTVVGTKSGRSIPCMTSFINPPTHWMPLPSTPQPAEPVKTDSAGYTLGPISEGGMDPRNANDLQARGEPVAWQAVDHSGYRPQPQQIPEGYGTEGLLLLGGDRHHRSCVAPTSDKPTSGAQNEIHAPQNKREAAIDQELVNTMNCTSDSFKTPAEAITALIDWHITVATDPAVNGGYKLVPIEPPTNCRQRLAKEGKPYPRSSCFVCGKLSPRHRECDAMLEAAPESKGKV